MLAKSILVSFVFFIGLTIAAPVPPVESTTGDVAQTSDAAPPVAHNHHRGHHSVSQSPQIQARSFDEAIEYLYARDPTRALRALQRHVQAQRPNLIRHLTTPPSHPTSAKVHELNEQKKKMVHDVVNEGKKINPHEVVNIWKNHGNIPNVKSRYMWLEKGNEKAGLAHIIKEHGVDFKNKGVEHHEIPELAEHAATHGTHVGHQGRDRPVMHTEFKGEKHHVGMTVGNNGFVVGMNPTSEGNFKPKKGGEGDKQ